MNLSRRVVRVRVAVALAGLTLTLSGCVLTSPPDVLRVTDPGDGRSGTIGGQDQNSSVKLRNFLVVSEGNGKAGTLVGAISNQTPKTVQVTLTIVQTGQDGQQSPIGTTTASVKAGEFLQFGDPAGGTGGTAAPSAPAQATSTPSPSTARSVGSSQTYTPAPSTTVSNPSDVGSEPATGLVVNYRIPSVPVPSGSILQLFARTADGGGTTIELPVLPPFGEYAYLAPKATASPTPSAEPSTGATGSPGATVTPSGSASPSVDTSGAAKTNTPSPSPKP